MLLGKNERTTHKKWWLIGGISLLAIILIGASLTFLLTRSPVNNGTYQLVKLSNDEIYFGKLSGLHNQFVTLDDAYLQAPSNSDDEEQDTNLTIVRISATVAKPEDTMYIARDEIVYWENLQKDSKIMNAIESQ